jgi:transcriptional regulator with XRE-family HTH domain
MGSARHPRSERLGEKLLQIRLALGFSQDGMLERLGLSDKYFRSRISAYELGEREPHLPILLLYARCVDISTDMNLPARLQKTEKRRRNRKVISPSGGKS